MQPTNLASIHTVDTESAGEVAVSLQQVGAGRPVLLLHGGAGPNSVTAFGTLLAETLDAHVLIPTHPGFAGTPRPDRLATLSELAAAYVQLLRDLDLADVTVVGNSIGGWIAAEAALLQDPRISRLVLLDAVGLSIAAHPIVDFFALTMDEVAELSYHDPAAFRIDVEALPEPAKRLMAGNRAALATYGGASMADATLLGRLPAIDVRTLVVWGAADRIVPPEHGRAYADAIPGARFELIAEAGHLPHLETPGRLAEVIRTFVTQPAG